MKTLDPIDQGAESVPPREPTQLSLATMRCMLIIIVSLVVWTGAAAMAVGAAHDLLDLSTKLTWFGGGAATLPVALSTFITLDRLIQAPTATNAR